VLRSGLSAAGVVAFEYRQQVAQAAAGGTLFFSERSVALRTEHTIAFTGVAAPHNVSRPSPPSVFTRRPRL
jgi:hypothetical protein